MFDQSILKSKDFGDMFRILRAGVAVRNEIGMEAMIKPDLFERLVKSPIEPLKKTRFGSYILDEYLSGFLQDRDRSRLYYCDPILQHIPFCLHFLSLLDLSRDASFMVHLGM